MKLQNGITVYHGAHKYKGEVPDRLSHLVPEKYRSEKPKPQAAEKDKPKKDK